MQKIYHSSKNFALNQVGNLGFWKENEKVQNCMLKVPNF